MKPVAKLAVLLLSSTVAACGGGGSGKTVVTPSASGEISTQPVGQDLSTLTQSIEEGRGFFQVNLESREGSASQVTIRSNFDVELNVGTRQILDFGDAESFSTNTADRQSLSVYHAAGDRAVIVMNTPNDAEPAGSTGPINGSLDYVTYGVWMTGSDLNLRNSRTGQQATDFAAFYGGIPTVLDDMPTTGTATYQGGVVAAELDRSQGTSQILTGPMTMTANFSTGSMSGRMDLNQASGATVTSLQTNDVRISGNTFAGSVSSTTGHVGQIDGVFAGNEASEIAGGFELNSADSTIHGAFGGAR